MTKEQKASVPTALETAEAFAETNGLQANLTRYAEIHEIPNGTGDYGVSLFTTDAGGHEVTVSVPILIDGSMYPANGRDGL